MVNLKNKIINSFKNIKLCITKFSCSGARKSQVRSPNPEKLFDLDNEPFENTHNCNNWNKVKKNYEIQNNFSNKDINEIIEKKKIISDSSSINSIKERNLNKKNSNFNKLNTNYSKINNSKSFNKLKNIKRQDNILHKENTSNIQNNHSYYRKIKKRENYENLNNSNSNDNKENYTYNNENIKLNTSKNLFKNNRLKKNKKKNELAIKEINPNSQNIQYNEIKNNKSIKMGENSNNLNNIDFSFCKKIYSKEENLNNNSNKIVKFENINEKNDNSMIFNEYNYLTHGDQIPTKYIKLNKNYKKNLWKIIKKYYPFIGNFHSKIFKKSIINIKSRNNILKDLDLKGPDYVIMNNIFYNIDTIQDDNLFKNNNIIITNTNVIINILNAKKKTKDKNKSIIDNYYKNILLNSIDKNYIKFKYERYLDINGKSEKKKSKNSMYKLLQYIYEINNKVNKLVILDILYNKDLNYKFFDKLCEKINNYDNFYMNSDLYNKELNAFNNSNGVFQLNNLIQTNKCKFIFNFDMSHLI